MSFFLGSKSKKTKPQYTGIQLQTASSSIPVTLLWGMNRIAPNIIWYGDFQSHKQKQSAGKGFGATGGTSYTYSASLILALCQGEIDSVQRVFRNQEKISDYTSLGFSLFVGSLDQAPWGYLTSNHPSEALSYSGIAYLACANYDLGSTASLPQHGFETAGLRYDTGILSNGDADPALVIQDLLTDEVFGSGFPEGVLDLDQLLSTESATTTGDGTYQTYCRVLGLGLNPALSTQESVSAILDRWTELTDTAIVWTGYSLKFIPYGTEEITANGHHYLPNTVSLYTLDDSALLADSGEPPVIVNRSDPADVYNSIKITVDNRANEYNQAPVEWKDQGLIDAYGLRQGNNIDAHEICSLEQGTTIISLIGQRMAYARNSYEFRVGPEYCLLEPMDIVTIRDPELGEVNVWIETFDEDGSHEFAVVAKEIPPGIVQSGSAQDVDNNPINTAADPGPVNPPLLFQPPLQLSGNTPQLWAAVSGGDGTDFNPLWGGCFIYVSTDDVTYQQIGEIQEPARQGIIGPGGLADYTGDNPDESNTLPVILTMSGGVLQSTTADEAERAATLCYVDGELISFEIATLTDTYEYDLTNLWRGLYSTEIESHAADAPFARLDESIFKYDLPASYDGITLYLKFQSYNIWGGGLQSLEDCVAYTYEPIIDPPAEVILDGGDPTGFQP